MLRSFNHHIFSILIFLVFTSTSVCQTTCASYQITCWDYPYYWCCSSSAYCGNYEGSCISYTTESPSTSNDLRTPAIVSIVAFGIICCSISIKFCIYGQRNQPQPRRTVVRTIPAERSRTAYQQQSVQRAPVLVIHGSSTVRATTAAPIHNVYEEPPPSYETATKYPSYNNPVVSAPPPPMS